ncbi:uncharacterized protein [Narcine bancroftii]|uniref:uncharacterized protein n=1 Tax=Narcine bancroftii TaxID=1343680 RepID=UPI00383177BA
MASTGLHRELGQGQTHPGSIPAPWLGIERGSFTRHLLCMGAEMRNNLRQGLKMLFSEVVELHSGDPQAMGQKPITFLRQVRSRVDAAARFGDKNCTQYSEFGLPNILNIFTRTS